MIAAGTYPDGQRIADGHGSESARITIRGPTTGSESATPATLAGFSSSPRTPFSQPARTALGRMDFFPSANGGLSGVSYDLRTVNTDQAYAVDFHGTPKDFTSNVWMPFPGSEIVAPVSEHSYRRLPQQRTNGRLHRRADDTPTNGTPTNGKSLRTSRLAPEGTL